MNLPCLRTGKVPWVEIQLGDHVVNQHNQKVGCIKEIRIGDVERREFPLNLCSVTVSSNEAPHILI